MSGGNEQPETTVDPADLPVLDLAAIGRLEEECGGDIGTLMLAFVREMRGRLSRIVELAASADLDGVWHEAHTLAGAASFYACPLLTQSAAALESAASTGATGQSALVDKLASALECAATAIHGRYAA